MSEYSEKSKFTNSEELANSISHLGGAFLSVLALILLLNKAAIYGQVIHIISSAVFGVSMIILYTSSGLMHSLRQGKLKNALFNLDKIAIFILIAGTYTPFSLISLKGGLGWTIFGIEWACALLGSVLILLKPVRFEKGVKSISVIVYAAMGWLILIAIVPLIKTMPTLGWSLVILGGILYSIGIYFYKKCSFRNHHLVWHLLVLGGTTAHYFAIYFFVIPGS